MNTVVQKQADIRYRVALKAHPGIVIYKVRSSDDTEDYDVTLVDGKVNNCTCREKFNSSARCYHMRDCQAREDMRNFSACRGCGHLKHGQIADYVCDQCRAQERETSQKGCLNGSSQGFSLLR